MSKNVKDNCSDVDESSDELTSPSDDNIDNIASSDNNSDGENDEIICITGTKNTIKNHELLTNCGSVGTHSCFNVNWEEIMDNLRMLARDKHVDATYIVNIKVTYTMSGSLLVTGDVLI